MDSRSLITCRDNRGIFLLRHSGQTVSGTYPASYPMDNGGSYLGDKAARA